MKIADYNQMMAYLTRPEPLPQPKPEELLDLQEQKRKDRLRKTMEEIGPGLMDGCVPLTSVSFLIEARDAQGIQRACGMDDFLVRVADIVVVPVHPVPAAALFCPDLAVADIGKHG